ncbi:hypothetical protein [Ottowia sp.]|uniref:hypothetical protein n=1 Tax=Ottowia sp. TaxID=1898956 RepID=UPI002C2089BC|nr:hypothetical protein [Ottowia sp.]
MQHPITQVTYVADVAEVHEKADGVIPWFDFYQDWAAKFVTNCGILKTTSCARTAARAAPPMRTSRPGRCAQGTAAPTATRFI